MSTIQRFSRLYSGFLFTKISPFYILQIYRIGIGNGGASCVQVDCWGEESGEILSFSVLTSSDRYVIFDLFFFLDLCLSFPFPTSKVPVGPELPSWTVYVPPTVMLPVVVTLCSFFFFESGSEEIIWKKYG